MSKFKCSNCDYISERKANVTTHINKLCKTGNIIHIKVDIVCEYCKKNFSTIPNLTRHLKTCKVKKQNLEKELALKNEENRILKEKLEVAEALANKPTIGTQNNINIQPEDKVYDDLHNEVKRVIYDRNHIVKKQQIKNKYS